MGWNTISEYSANALVTEANQKFYFVHSFYVETEEPEETILKTSYGVDFASGVAFKNIFGVQFHPEKSHKYGMSLLSKFDPSVLTKRIIPTSYQGGARKTTRFKNPVYIGDPCNTVRIFNEIAVDEILLLDIAKRKEKRA